MSSEPRPSEKETNLPDGVTETRQKETQYIQQRAESSAVESAVQRGRQREKGEREKMW